MVGIFGREYTGKPYTKCIRSWRIESQFLVRLSFGLLVKFAQLFRVCFAIRHLANITVARHETHCLTVLDQAADVYIILIIYCVIVNREMKASQNNTPTHLFHGISLQEAIWDRRTTYNACNTHVSAVPMAEAFVEGRWNNRLKNCLPINVQQVHRTRNLSSKQWLFKIWLSWQNSRKPLKNVNLYM